MTVGVVTADALPSTGGVQAVLWHLASAYARHGHRSAALCPGQTGPDRWGALSLSRRESPAFSLRRWARDPFLLKREVFHRRTLFRHWQADIIHLHALGAEALYAALAARSMGIPAIATIHGFKDFGTLSRVGLWLERLICRSCRAITTCCDADRQGLVARHPALTSRTVTIPNGVDLPARTDSWPAVEPGTVTFVGRLTRQKGLDVLLRAWEIMEQENAARSLVVIGSGPDEVQLHALAEQLQLRSVTWRGDLPPQAVLEEMRRVTAVCLPSRWEGMPLVALEAMACGRPIVASDVGGIGEIAQDGVTGLLVPPENPRALADALCRLLQTPDVAARMGWRGREVVEKKYSWERVSRQYLELYAQSGAGGRGARSAASNGSDQTDMRCPEVASNQL